MDGEKVFTGVAESVSEGGSERIRSFQERVLHGREGGFRRSLGERRNDVGGGLMARTGEVVEEGFRERRCQEEGVSRRKVGADVRGYQDGVVDERPALVELDHPEVQEKAEGFRRRRGDEPDGQGKGIERSEKASSEKGGVKCPWCH